jgi:aryl-phospho-beta-D-glucosidase BglC (GH1 family)
MRDDTNISVIIIYSFVFIFIVFLLLQQGNFIAQPTGYALFDTTIFQDLTNLSLTTLIIIVVGLILLIVGGFFIYKKIKAKKKNISGAPQVSQAPEKSITDLSKEFNLPLAKKNEKQELSILDEDINKLFSESAPEPEVEKPLMKEVIKDKEVMENKQGPKFNLVELKQLVKSLMKKNYTKESIIKYLNNKGFTLIQIKSAINSINEDSLVNYIKDALSEGFSKQEIMKSLLSSGWDREDILKYLS